MICLPNVCIEISPSGTRYVAGPHCVCVCVCNPSCVVTTAGSQSPLPLHFLYLIHTIQPTSNTLPTHTHTHSGYSCPAERRPQGTMNDSLTCCLLCMLPLKHLYSLTHEISFECNSPPHCSPLITIHTQECWLTEQQCSHMPILQITV